MIIKGLPNKTKAENITAMGKIVVKLGPIKSCDPKAKKKMVRKKSLKGLVLETICKCSGSPERERPAKKPPISILKFNGPDIKEVNPKAQARLPINKSSAFCAKAFSKKDGITFLDRYQTPKNNANALIIIKA